jgi:hypothetical protein
MQQRMALRGMEVSAIPFEKILDALQKKHKGVAILVQDTITLRECVGNTVREINTETQASNARSRTNKSGNNVDRTGWAPLVEQVTIRMDGKGKNAESIAVATYGTRKKFVAPVEMKDGELNASSHLCMWVAELVKQLQGSDFQAREINLLWSTPGATHQGVHMDMCAPAAGAPDTGISLLLPIGSGVQYLNAWPGSNHLSQAAANCGFDAFKEFEAGSTQRRLWGREFSKITPPATHKIAYEQVSIDEGCVAGFLPHLIHSGFKNDSERDLLRMHVYVLRTGVKKEDNFVMPVPEAVKERLEINPDMIFMAFSKGEAMDKGHNFDQPALDSAVADIQGYPIDTKGRSVDHMQSA